MELFLTDCMERQHK